MKKFVYSLCAAGLMLTAVPVLALGQSLSGKVGPEGVTGAAEDEVQVLDVKAMTDLDDQKLMDAYLDVVVEIEALKMFHSTSGFTPKQYKKYKSLLKYRLQLLFEIHRRKIEIPADIK